LLFVTFELANIILFLILSNVHPHTIVSIYVNGNTIIQDIPLPSLSKLEELFTQSANELKVKFKNKNVKTINNIRTRVGFVEYSLVRVT